jgi:hypothetical protein
MSLTFETIHSALRAAKALTLAFYTANMDSRKNSMKSDGPEDESHENTPFSHNDALYNTPVAHHEKRIVQERVVNRNGGLLGMFQNLVTYRNGMSQNTVSFVVKSSVTPSHGHFA